ncbi:MAG: hypothetical protein VW230_05305 [Candidatus Poseidoniales archaeon]
MTSASLSMDINGSMLVPLLLSGISVYIFWTFFVPRQLKGLQVAFITGDKKYEVHSVTKTKEDVKKLLHSKTMRMGIFSYLLALTGCLIFLFEFFQAKYNGTMSYNALNIAIALVAIILPASLSSGTSLGAQVIRPIGTTRATLQSNTLLRTFSHIALFLAWVLLSFTVFFIMTAIGYSSTFSLTISAFVAFSPAVLAYGRILGAAWQALYQSSGKIAEGKASPFHNHIPNLRQQLVAQVVRLNLFVMPFIAVNTLISLIILFVSPDMFTHSDRVLELPEYRLQSTYMEEGGLLGFGLIELFSYIPQPGIRVPIVTFLLLFLLLNVAIVGFLFVYEVARILFLDVQDVSGRGGMKLADSRLLRAEPSQQAKVLNFCFTGFAGQSMLLLALAMITFWDSSFLPQGASCGTWETTVCHIVEKDAMEQLTWMLASGGQVAFLFVWLMSLSRRTSLEEISFDSQMEENRSRLSQMSDIIYLKQTPIGQLIKEENWGLALERYGDQMYTHEQSIEGLEMVREHQSKLSILTGLGLWDQAEEVAINYLALKGGREADIAKLSLVSASLAQRDIRETLSRLPLVSDENIESLRFIWLASLMSSKDRLDPSNYGVLSIDPVTQQNIKLITRTLQGGEIKLDPRLVKDDVGKMMFLGEIGRMRLKNRSEEALTVLEKVLKDDKNWIQGRITQSLLHLDGGRRLSAQNIAIDLWKQHPRHPWVRAMQRLYADIDLGTMPSSEDTGMEWAINKEANWRSQWRFHRAAVPPLLDSQGLKEHAFQANAWILFSHPEFTIKKSKKKYGKFIPDHLPIGLFLHMSGIVVSVAGVPIDLGYPPLLMQSNVVDKASFKLHSG